MSSGSVQPGICVKRLACPACAGSCYTSVYQKPYGDPEFRSLMDLLYGAIPDYPEFEHADYEVAKCQKCGCFYQTTVLTDAGLVALYDRWIDPSQGTEWSRQSATKKAGVWCQRLAFAGKHLGSADIRILDWGAGLGHFCLLAKGMGFDAQALELSAERRSVMARIGIHSTLPQELPTGYYHFVHLDQVIEHVTEPFSILLQIHRALRPGGLLFVGTPDSRGLEADLQKVDRMSLAGRKKALLRISAFQHINAFNHRSLTALCERAGFRVFFRPLLYLACSGFGTSWKEVAKNVARPFYQRFSTAFFLEKALGGTHG